MRHLAAREYELVDELTAGWALRYSITVNGSDAVIEGKATGPQESRDRFEIERQIGDADMLVHSDRDDLVENRLSRNFAVVPTADFDPAGKTVGGGAIFGISELLIAERTADAVDPVTGRGPAQQAAPAAADVEKPVTGLEPQLAAEAIELLLLRRIEILIAVLKISA